MNDIAAFYAMLTAGERRRFAALPWYKKLWVQREIIGCLLFCTFIVVVFWYGMYKGWQSFGPHISISRK